MSSWEAVQELLTREGPLTPKEIIMKTRLAPRTVNFALRKLLKNKVVVKIPNLTDMRSPIYHLTGEGDGEQRQNNP